MKKQLKTILVLSFISIMSYFVYHIYTKIQYKKEVAAHIKTIPQFEYLNTKGGVFTNQNLKKDTPTLFIYFNTECGFCNEEAQMIQQNIEKFAAVQLIFISFEKPKAITAFAAKHRLNGYRNVYFLCDTQVTFATTLDIKSLPCLVLYNKNQQLIEKIKGQTKTEILIKKLERL